MEAKKNQMTKNSIIGSLKLNNLKKPFGFCCDVNHQDFDTQYNMRNPPFESTFSDTLLRDSRPDLRFRIQDIAKSAVHHQPDQRGGIFQDDIINTKKPSTYGKSVKNRGAFKWFLEDEILIAQEILAAERKKIHDEKIKNDLAMKNGNSFLILRHIM